MKLTSEEQDMLDGKYGKAAKKSMEILTTLGEIFDAEYIVSDHLGERLRDKQILEKRIM